MRQPAEGSSASLRLRVGVLALIVVGVAASFAYAADWIGPPRLTPSRMVDAFELANGRHPGFRRNHSKGVCVTGSFDSSGRGSALSKAVVFRPGRVPVMGRFALAGGQPYVRDTPRAVRSMALRFMLPNGEEWRTGMNDTPVFSVRTPEAFYDQLLASVPDPSTGKPDPARLAAFGVAHPESVAAKKLIDARTPSPGFATSTYNSLNAFLFTDDAGASTAVRWSMVPLQTSEAVPPAADNSLFDALIAAVHDHPLQWRLVVVVAGPGDAVDDATLAWPPERRQLDVGTLTIDHIESEDASPVRDITFDPLVLPNGIAGSDDPLLSARSAAYAAGFRRREGETKDHSAVTEQEAPR
jgi:catalase